MPKKRRNNGRDKHGRGHTRTVVCAHCGCVAARGRVVARGAERARRRRRRCKPSKDKAIKRFVVRNIVDSGAMNDLKIACAYECACRARGRTRCVWPL
jgi:small subunit ribosomal protein S26e